MTTNSRATAASPTGASGSPADRAARYGTADPGGPSAVEQQSCETDARPMMTEELVLAFGYNAAAIPVAAGVLYPFTGVLLSPLIAAAAMALSSISVVVNSTRLNTFTPPQLDGRQRAAREEGDPSRLSPDAASAG